MVYYPGEDLRKIGESVGNAILAPVQARLQAEELKKKREKESAQKELEKSLDPKERILYAAEGMDAVFSQRKLLEERASRVSRSSGSSRSFGGGEGDAGFINKYDKQFSLIRAYEDEMKRDLSADLEKLTTIKDPEKYNQAVEAFNVKAKFYDENLKGKISSMDKDMSFGYIQKLMQVHDENMKTFTPEKIDLMSQVLDSGMKDLKVDPKIMEKLDSNTKYFGMDMNLKGIPSRSQVNQFFVAAETNKAISREDKLALFDTKDPSELIQIINNDSLPEELRIGAGLLFKKNFLMQKTEPDTVNSLKKLSNNELAEIGFDPARSATDRIRSAATKELSNRGVLKDKETTTGRKSLGSNKEAKAREAFQRIEKNTELIKSKSQKPSVTIALKKKIEQDKELLKSMGLI